MADSMVDVFQVGELAIFWQPQQDVQVVHIDRVISVHGQGSFAEYEVTGLESKRKIKVAGCWLQKPQVTEIDRT